MPAKSPETSAKATAQLHELGRQIANHRKTLRVSATALAEAAGISRVTLHRIEKGEPSVTAGAFIAALSALGLQCSVIPSAPEQTAAHVENPPGWLPARIALVDYPQLQQLAWQVQGIAELTPQEALGLYERNWRHVDETALTSDERHLIDALRLALGKPHV